MSALTVAETKRATEIRQLQIKVDRIDADLAKGTNGANGMADPYLVQRAGVLTGEKARISEQIEQLAALEGGKLTERYIPAPVEPISLRESLSGRGAMVPGQAVVNVDGKASVRNEGGQAYPVNPVGLPEGFVPGETFYSNK